MAVYEPGDIVTYYFVIVTDNHGKRIQAYSDNKELIKAYMEFHKCKRFQLKAITNTIEEINKIVDENMHDKVELCNILIRDPESKKHNKTKSIVIPITDTEINFIQDEINTFMTSKIAYGYMNGAIPYLKNRWREALHDIMLDDVIQYVVNNRPSKKLQMISFDQLLVLLRMFPDYFGR